MAVTQRVRLLHESEVAGIAVPAGTIQWLVDGRLGALHVMSYRLQVTARPAASHGHPGCEEALYVVQGKGRVWIEGVPHDVSPGTAVLIPDGAEHGIERTGEETLVIVGAMAPPIDLEKVEPVIPHLTVGAPGNSAPIDERAVRPTMMGERSFRLLANPDLGARHMTQFTGVIPTGRAPLHAHPHEEAVYVLAGTGRLWIEDQAAGALRVGSVIFFPIGVRHTLENTGSQDLKVLGTFSPAGSPAAKLPPNDPAPTATG